MAIIGISGKIGSGKDTVAKIIQIITDNPHFTDKAVLSFLKRDLLKPSIKIKKFADKLKDIVCLLIGCTREQLEDREFKEKELGEEWWYWYMKLDGGYGTIMLNYLTTTKEQLSMYEGLVLVKPTPRLLLQLLGTECGRQIIHPNIWVNALMANYKPQKIKGGSGGTVEVDVYPKWIITDVRFTNEVKAIKDRGGILIRVERFCYDSAEDFLVCNPNSKLRKIGIQDYNINRILSLEEITDIAKANGYVPLSEQHKSETALDNYQDFDYVIKNNGTIEDLIEKVRLIFNNTKW